MSRPKSKSDQPRRASRSATHLACRRMPAQCQPLEARRLLAVMFDPSFGEGDGFTVLPTGIDANPDPQLFERLIPGELTRLSGGYFVRGEHSTVTPGPDPVVAESRTLHALVEDDGSVSDDLVRDANGDGLVFYDREGSNGDFFGPGNYTDIFPLDDGSAIALLPASDPLQSRIVRLLANGRESPFFEIGGVGEILAIEPVTPSLGIYIARVEAAGAEAPLEDADFVLEVRMFRIPSGELVGATGLLPFGNWLRADRTLAPPTLHVGRDGAIYVGVLTTDLDGADSDPDDTGFLLARLLRSSESLRIDTGYGTPLFPGQETRAFYMPSPHPFDVNFFGLDLIGATSDGRAWIMLPHPDTQDFAVTLLSPVGRVDPGFGSDGFVSVDFFGTGGSGTFSFGLFHGIRDELNSEPKPLVRGDGSIVGMAAIPDGSTDIPAGTDLAYGVYGIMPDGMFDTRIAAEDSLIPGLSILTRDLDNDPDVSSTPDQTVLLLDDAERLVIAAGVLPTQAGVDTGTVDLLYARILLGTPRMEVVERPNGDRVLEIEGTSGDDRYIFRPGFPGFELFQQPIGALPSSIARFASDVDRVEIMGGEGNDLLFSEVSTFSGFITVTGGLGDDTLSANGRFDRIFGDEGNDSLLGGLGAQLMFGGAGNDTLAGGSGRDALFGEEGDDVLHGQSEGDFLSGGDGNDVLFGHGGNDTLEGGLGDDTLDGGDEIDLLSYASHALPVVASLFDGTGGAAGEQDTLVTDTLERILGTSGDDLLTGNNGRNFLVGGDGNDTLQGLGGDDTLLGGDGADVLDGGGGDDLLVDFTPLGLGGGPDVFIGGGGFDFALADDEDDADEDVEGVFNDLGALLTAIDQRNTPPA